MSDRIFIVCGLGYGDEGKGTIVDFLARRFDLKKVMRFNGGPQAGHNVISPEGIHHCCAQFGSGVLIPGVCSYIAAPTLFSPLSLMLEEEELRHKGILDGLDRLFVDEECYLVTPFHTLANRIKELARGDNRHGSCGKGVGETAYAAETYGDKMPQAKDLPHAPILKEKLRFLKSTFFDKTASIAKILRSAEGRHPELLELYEQLKEEDPDHLAAEYADISAKIRIIPHDEILKIICQGGVIFEGAQGMLLDQKFGFNPYTTRSNAGFDNALGLISGSCYAGLAYRLAVTRSYMTRHGHGPFVTEDARLNEMISPCHNTENPWQGALRLGWFDAIALRYALNCLGGADGLALTNLDRFPQSHEAKICGRYWLDNPEGKEALFEFDGLNSIKAIRKKTPPNKTLATVMDQCRPVYFNISDILGKNEADYRPPNFQYASLIAKLLELPLALTSVSPIASGKICRIE